jgi:uncharacterized protein (TIGR02996 family)
VSIHKQFAAAVAAVERLRYASEVESEHPAQPFLNAIEENPESFLHRGVFADWLEENPQYIHGHSPTGDHSYHVQQTLDSLRGDEHPIVVRHPLSGNVVAWRDPGQQRQLTSSDHLNVVRQETGIAPVNVLRDGVFHGPAGVAAVSIEPYFNRPDQDGRSHIAETFSTVSGSRLNRLGRYVDEQSARVAAIRAAFGDE